jgi:hypothetical protein
MRRLLTLPLALALLAAAGCGGDDDSTTIRLLIPDNNIRVEGVECAGATPFERVHRGTRFTIDDGAGEVLVEGELPAGVSENADPSVDWGVERIPTNCVMELDVDLPERPRYRLRVDGEPPLPFDSSVVAGDAPVQLSLAG